ncbi:MAG: hypothetical protein LCH43_01250 [Actinobacteria bacterium]|nr:hypothetical protein [Actinomycetota bacterium]
MDEMREGDGSIDAVWAATSPDSGRFDPMETRSAAGVLRSRLAELEARGAGYLEVRRLAREFPVLSLGFRGSEAVVQAFRSADDVAILTGWGKNPSGAITVPILHEEATFDSWAGVSLQSAWELIEAFLRGAELESLGAWVEL